MKVIVFGATGMVGQGVLRECLLDPEVDRVLAVGRSASGQRHEKLREIEHADFTDFSSLEPEFAAYDACFFCLGVSSVGMKEPAYRRITYDFTVAAGKAMASAHSGMVFVYVSGAGTSSQSGTMWSRVKGSTEDALFDLPLHAYMFRPGFIQPMHGIRSRTKFYNALYRLAAPLVPLIRRLFPDRLITTEQVGQAMLVVAKRGSAKRVFGSRDIAALANRER